MTNTEIKTEQLYSLHQSQLKIIFSSGELLYAVIYLMAKNEHYYQSEKPEGYEQLLKTVHYIQQRTKNFLTASGLDAEELMADIASDYFEDFIAYKDRIFSLTNEHFLSIIRILQNWRETALN